MVSLRLLIDARRGWLALLMACTLATKLLVPAGFMPAVADGRLTLAICSGSVPVQPMAMPMPGMHHDAGGQDRHGKAEMPCGFAGLGHAALAAVDPVLIAAAILGFFLFLLRRPARLPPAPKARLRPPLRAPPPIV